jgi:hypothetical protein
LLPGPAVDDAERDEILTYRQALREYPARPSFESLAGLNIVYSVYNFFGTRESKTSSITK